MRKVFTIFGIVVLVGVASLGTILLLTKNQSPVPKDIQNQVNFAIFYPPNTEAKVQKGSFKYDSSIQSVSFIVDFMNRQVTFAEQSSPVSFTDDPTIYPKFVEKLNNYATFDTINGRVDLTRPSNVNSEAGVLNAKGTLMFARSDGDLSQDSWRELFNALLFTKPK